MKDNFDRVLIFALIFIGSVMGGKSAFAQAKVGTTGLNFLELEVAARSMGMGGAFTAVVDDISAIHYNPAGLTFLFSNEVMFTQVTMPADINLNFAAIGIPLDALGGVVGFGFTWLSTGDILYTTPENPLGKDQFGNERFFSAADYAVSASYGRYLTDRFSVGVTMKWLREELETSTASGWAADVGTIYNTGFRDFKVAMAITNFGADMRHIETDFPLPIDFKFGASINFIQSPDHLGIFSMEGSHPSDNLEKYRAGAEYWFVEKYALRGGLQYNYDLDSEFFIVDGGTQRTPGLGFSLGGGIRVPFAEESEMRIDYAYQDYGILTEVHRFTLAVRF